MMKIVVTLDEAGQVEVYADGPVEAVLIDNSSPADVNGYVERDLGEDYRVEGTVHRLRFPFVDEGFVCEAFALAQEVGS